ncbi:MAG TPA: AmmeMemoRadiSam system protein A [Candidatus Dormibacteraeota bacterium]|nr:AmmeMemoRadiSam system protein A [Candidatus Dormibacteraeota bacterium]
MPPLLSSDKQFVLQVSREALLAAVEARFALDDFPPSTNLPLAAGAFATLHRRGRLRGCIGQIGAPQPIVPLVAYCARAAALEDPRYGPVQIHEVPEIEIELSILSALEEISLDRIEIGKHGLMVTRGANRGVLLPQVATQHHLDALSFLEEVCAKAGLDRSAWRKAGTRLQAFTAEVFAESELYAGSTGTGRRAGGGTSD